MLKYWPALRTELRDRIFPAIRTLCATDISAAVTPIIREQLPRVVALFNKLDELTTQFGVGLRPSPTLEAARDAMTSGLSELHRLLLEDDTDTIFALVRSLRTDPERILRRIVGQRHGETAQLGIDVELQPSASGRRVFGHEVEVYSIFNILIENVLTRAFSASATSRLTQPRMSIRLADIPDRNSVTVEVLDNGVGVAFPLRSGGGLTALKSIAETLCAGWGLADAGEAGFTTRAHVQLYAFRER